jgi:hypothetical protein
MQETGRLKIMLVVLAAMVVFGGVIWYQFKNPPRPAPLNVGVYYTGPMKNKSGKPFAATEDGKITPLPESPSKQAQPQAESANP